MIPIAMLTACQSSYAPPKTRSSDTLTDVYRSTLVQCAGEPQEYRRQDDNEWMTFQGCTVRLVAGHVVAQTGNCTPYLRCR